MNRPPQISENFWHELIVGSAIAPTLAALNCQSIQGDAVYEVLLYAKSRQEIRRNDGRLRDSWLNKYRDLAEAGGLYLSGLDPQKNWAEPMEWGRFKANTPRLDREGKPQKYESPLRPATNRVSYFRADLEIWELVARRYNIPMPENITTSAQGEALGFWAWVVSHPEIPIILCEGEKKALCLLSLGFVAIALPGIWGGRVGQVFLERLHPDLMPVAQKGRKFVILFDHETRPKTKKDIFNATRRTGQCILNAGCKCEVAVLPGPEKGIDDWVVAQGEKADQAVTALIDDALTLKEYQQLFFIPLRGLRKYQPNVRFNLRYLSQGVEKLPESGLVCLLSDLGTGKTYLLEKWRDDHPDERFLNNGHRVNLLKNLAERLKTQMYSAVKASDLGRNEALSITIDSLYKLAHNLQAYGCLFIDEAAQYVAHLLRSKTCKKFRAEILETLEYLVRNSKLVVLADAHLDDITIDFFKAMRSEGEEPFIIQNDWRSGGRQVYWYEGDNDSALVAAIHAALLDGKKLIVVSDTKRFIKKLESSLSNASFDRVKLVEDLIDQDDNDEDDNSASQQLKIWALTSENSGSQENVALIKDITNSVKLFDVLLTSPTIGSGVDICGGKGEYHFDLIFGAFHAVSQPATECAQQLWRYRPNVPMHVWTAKRPSFGYGESNPRKIKEQILQKNEMTAFLIRIDRETGKRGAEKDWALDAYCQIEARRNRSLNNLRQDLRSLLEEMGNTIIPMGDEADEAAKQRMKAAGEAIDQAHCLAVANSKDIERKVYESRQRQDYLSPDEFLECEKFRIRDTYGMEVTPELVKKDDGRRLIRKIVTLEAILAEPGEAIADEQGREFLTPPSIVVEADLSERENLPICTDWLNQSTAWMMRQKLGLRELLQALIAGAQYSNESELIQLTVELSHQFAPQIKAILGRTIAPNASNCKIIGEYLEQLGLSTSSQRPKNGDKRGRIYRLEPDDVKFALQVISYRQQKRQERERQRQEQRERNAHHAAMMQQRWGGQPMSTPPEKSRESTNPGGVDTNQKQVEILPKNEQETIKVYGQMLLDAFVYGIEAIKELLKAWTSEERWAAFLEFEDIAPEKMEQLRAIAPDWYEWCDA
jgi:predicted nucleic acid-binding protein